MSVEPTEHRLGLKVAGVKGKNERKQTTSSESEKKSETKQDTK
jgi:hypothetical protein